MSGHASPEEAATADDAIPGQSVTVVAVDYSPRRDFAVVLIEYNESPTIEPYVLLCERTEDGWVPGRGMSAGGSSWMSTTEDGSLGVAVLWGSSAHRVEWDVAGGPEFDAAPDAGQGDW